MNRREFLKGAAAVALAPTALAACAKGPPRNLLILTVDDMDGSSPGCFGGPAGATPHIDALAAEGMRFDRFHVTTSVCRPSRIALLTGRYPHRSGVGGAVRPGVPLLTDPLREAGHLRGILGKVDHHAPVRLFHWDVVYPGEELGDGRDPEAYGRVAGGFFSRARKEHRPFFLLANSHDPHRPFARAPRGSAGAGPVPGFLPALPAVQQEVARYFASVRRADATVGAILDALAASGLAEETLVVLLSDNGMSFPFAKTNCYLRSTRVPCVVRWPGVVAPGSVHAAPVAGIDLAPTLLEALALPALPGMDGSSFLPALRGEPGDRERPIVTLVETDFRARPTPMRALHRGRLGYIYNAWSDGRRQFMSEAEQGATMPAMERAARTDPALARRVRFYRLRQPEELYDFEADPDGLRDLSADPRFAGDVERLRAELLAWMERTGDPLRPRFADHLAGLGSGPA